MPFLYEKLDSLREFGAIAEMPKLIPQNLNPNFKLRPYQEAAFENFITYFQSEKLCQKPTQTLFHMATGSGKTMIMAGIIIYLYKQGYRNFIFFVNLSNIVQKTKENFLNNLSNKYLFADEIVIEGEKVKIKEATNFQYSDDSAINICFTTTQGLHSDMWLTKENSVSFDDFQNKKIVLISDEAHHLNADTKKMNKDEEESYHSWENTVHRIFNACRDNVLLEFTATCDLKNPNIKAEYESKIIFDYPLYKFREDKYSKEIKTLRTDVTIIERCMQAIIFSQYRLKVFQDNRLAIKPVILFKAAKIQDSKDFMAEFIDTVAQLNAAEIERISTLTENQTLQEAFIYFANKGISYAQLAQELKDEFSAEHCISANDEKEAAEKQIALNSLEDKNNPYRAIFEVKKLDEGWDVLNLFDIVRLYETRQSGGKKISPATVSEAQLIGRGSRYCPFQIDAEQEKYKRKYDNDLDNPLRICEELYYHCQNDSRYIGELHSALREIGIDLDKTVAKEYKLKADFKQDNLYKEGLVFINQKNLVSRNEVTELLPSVRDHEYVVTFATGASNEDLILDDELKKDRAVKTVTVRKTFSEIARINYAIVQRALCKYPVYKFNTLQSYFPNLKSTREFITSGDYLGNIKIAITTKYENPPLQIINRACSYVVGKIANVISGIEETYQGTTEFTAKHLHEVFKDKRVNYTDPHDGGVGISQNDHTVPNDWKLDLSNEDWFVFEDNFGTSEEKAFVAYFKTHIDRLKMEYDKVYLVRNERQFAIYSFVAGERFEPDYVLFLRKNKTDGFEQIQIFVEPKGTHLLQQDSWKQDFMLELEEKAVPVTEFVDDNEYKIWGFHFFNAGDKKDLSGIKQEFVDDMAKI